MGKKEFEHGVAILTAEDKQDMDHINLSWKVS